MQSAKSVSGEDDSCSGKQKWMYSIHWTSFNCTAERFCNPLLWLTIWNCILNNNWGWGLSLQRGRNLSRWVWRARCFQSSAIWPQRYQLMRQVLQNRSEMYALCKQPLSVPRWCTLTLYLASQRKNMCKYCHLNQCLYCSFIITLLKCARE